MRSHLTYFKPDLEENGGILVAGKKYHEIHDFELGYLEGQLAHEGQ